MKSSATPCGPSICLPALTDVAMETENLDYESAAMSLWDNFVNKKYYLTGGAGSGATAEGFGDNYVLPDSSYCETCAGCGTLFFFHKLNLAYQDAKYRGPDGERAVQ